MDWFRMMYEGKGTDQPEKPSPKGLRRLGQVLLENWWELIGLNLLFFFSCIFLITIPAALTALTMVCVALLNGEYVSIPAAFWKGFRGSFLRNTAAGLLWAAALGVTGWGVRFYGNAMAENGLLAAPAMVLLILFLLVLMSGFSLFQMAAFSELKVLQMVKNALLLTLVHPGRHLLVLLVLAVLTAAYFLCFPYSTVALTAIALSAFWLFACNRLWPLTQKYVFPEEETAWAG